MVIPRMSVLAHNVAVRYGICLSLAVMAAQTFGAAPQAAAPTAVTGIPVAAVWREQHLDFFYMGRTSRYSCDGLRDKVRAMLLDLGARRDLKIAAIGCADDDRPPMHAMPPSLDITFSAPALPDNAAKPLHVGDLAAADARFE